MRLRTVSRFPPIYYNTLYFLLNLPAGTQWQLQSHENKKVKNFLPNPPSCEDKANIKYKSNTCWIKSSGFSMQPLFLKTVNQRGEILGALLQARDWSNLSAPLSSSLQTSTLPWSAAYITAFFPAFKYFQYSWYWYKYMHTPNYSI